MALVRSRARSSLNRCARRSKSCRKTSGGRLGFVISDDLICAFRSALLALALRLDSVGVAANASIRAVPARMRLSFHNP